MAAMKGSGDFLATVATAGLVLVVLGYVMSLVTLIIRRFFWYRDLELPLDEDSLAAMRERLLPEPARKDVKNSRPDKLATVVAFQARHWKAAETKWAERRWMNIGICLNGIVAVLVGLGVGRLAFEVPLEADWLLWSIGLLLLFSAQIYFTYFELQQMHWLLARVPEPATNADDDQ